MIRSLPTTSPTKHHGWTLLHALVLVGGFFSQVHGQDLTAETLARLEQDFENPREELPAQIELGDLDERREALLEQLMTLRRAPRAAAERLDVATNQAANASTSTNVVPLLKAERLSEVERSGIRRLELHLTLPRSRVANASNYLEQRRKSTEEAFAHLSARNTNWRHQGVIDGERQLVDGILRLRTRFHAGETLAPDTPQKVQGSIDVLKGRLQVLGDMDLAKDDPLLGAVRLSFIEHRLLDLDLRGEAIGNRVPVFRNLQGTFQKVWYFPLYRTEAGSLTVGKLLTLLLFIILGLKAARFFSRLVERRLRRFKRFSSHDAQTYRTLVFYLLVVIVFFVSLQAAHVPAGIFAVLGGAIAVGVGFGSQNLLSNFISGIILLFERPIRGGDLVTVENMLGTVKSVGLRCTTVGATDGRDMLVPNSKFLESSVINWTFEDRLCRSTVHVGVAYGSDTRRVADVLLDAALGTEGVLSNPIPTARFEAFGDSALEFRVDFWIHLDGPPEQRRIEGEFRHNVAERLKESGFEVPFPQRDLHLKSGFSREEIEWILAAQSQATS